MYSANSTRVLIHVVAGVLVVLGVLCVFSVNVAASEADYGMPLQLFETLPHHLCVWFHSCRWCKNIFDRNF